MRVMKAFAKVAATIFPVAFIALLIVTAIAHFQVSHKAAKRVTPVLSSRWDSTDSGFARTEDLLERVLKDNTDAGDQASVILLDYYLGEQNYENQIVNITQRGKRVLPYLVKYRSHPVLPLRPDFWLFRFYGAERNRRYDEAIDMFRQGKVLQE
jgi:hypothetical protein